MQNSNERLSEWQNNGVSDNQQNKKVVQIANPGLIFKIFCKSCVVFRAYKTKKQSIQVSWV